MLDQEVDGLLAGPGEGVEACVDDETTGPQRVHGEHAEPLQRRRVQAHFVGESFGVESPSLFEGSDLQVGEHGVQIELARQADLQVMAGNRFVEHGGWERVSGPARRLGGVEEEATGTVAVWRWCGVASHRSAVRG